MGCVFCGISSGGVPARVVGSTGLSVAFLDAFPLARGHVLVVPRAHRARLQEMTPEENADLFGLVRDLVAGVDSVGGSTLLAIHNGPGAGQEVPHVHVHMVPRSAGDGAGPIHSMFGGPQSLSEAELDEACRLVGKEPLP